MHKFFNIILLSLFLLFLFPSLSASAKEDQLKYLSILVYLHEDGSATIGEKRTANLTEGTENFDVIENLGKSKITDFFVQENDARYEYVPNWDQDASRQEKTFKNSIIETDKGYELVWGIGEYGEHEYIIVYTVTDFIKQLKDSQILFWRFVNDDMNIPPENVSIQVETNRPITNDTEKIWAFGFQGDIKFEDEKVVAESEKPFEQESYATVLIQFPSDTFQTEDIIDKTFAEIQEDAFEGSDYGKRQDLRFLQDILPYIVIGFVFFGPLIALYVYRFYRWRKKNKDLDQLAKKYKGQYYRDLPYEGAFIDLFYLLQKHRLASYNTIMLAYLLKWMSEDKVTLHTEWKKSLFKKKQITIIFHPSETIENEYEHRLFNILIQLAGPNQPLTLRDHDVWTTELREAFADWADDIYTHSLDTLVKKDYLKKEVNVTFLDDVEEHNVTEKGEKLCEKLYQFSYYLIDFSLVHEHDAANVKIWDTYLIWATALGLTDVVRDQFRKINPRLTQQSIYDKQTFKSLDSFTHHIVSVNYPSISNTTDGSSGSGGPTSIGGGGGSFGGGSGGGTR